MGRHLSATLFPLGKVETTQSALVAFERNYARFALSQRDRLVARHQSGDWGYVSVPNLVERNEYAVSHDLPVLSAYRLTDGQPIWIVTTGNRSCTRVLLPDEYPEVDGN